ncbi:MAG: hypothetical protein JWO46_1063 [Nocardioidaceae bacterium]|nr:hypothetical protein [Nocardioidaceae bacterium]
MTTSGLRIGAATFTAGVLLLLAGCGQTAADRAAVINGSTSPLPGVTASPAGATDGASASPSATASTPAATASPVNFQAGLDDYCTRVYADQLKADQEHPNDQTAFAWDTANAWNDDQAMLADLTPPSDLAGPYASFVKASRTIADLREKLTSNPPAHTYEDYGLSDALAARRPFAKRLGASRCDGELPTAQRNAAVATLSEMTTTTDPRKLCQELVTPEFVPTTFSTSSDPVAACVATARARAADHPGPVRVKEVTGVDEMTATVTYDQEITCGCDVGVVARLYYFDGSWKVRSIS